MNQPFHPPVDADVALEVISHEAIVRQAYKDSRGIWTWGVGMTNATGHRVERYIDNPVPLQRVMHIFQWALKNYAAGVYRAFAGIPITKAQLAAALSFHWNTGAIERAEWVRLWKQGKIKEARVSMVENWDNPPEIRARRLKEAALFFDGKWTNDGTATEYTRVTKAHTPDWKSAKKVSVADELRTAFGAQTQVMPDIPMKPEAPVDPAATLPPVKSPDIAPPKDTGAKAPAGGIGVGVIAALIILAAAGYAAWQMLT